MLLMQLAVVVVCATLPYLAGGVLQLEWSYDDKVAVLHNVDVRGDLELQRWLSHDFWGRPMWPEQGQDGVAWTHQSYRPMSVLVLHVLWRHLLGGSPSGPPSAFVTAGMHAAALVFHAVTCVLAWLVCRALFAVQYTASRTQSTRAALVAAVLFAVHPVHCEVVASVTSSVELLAASCTLAALLLYRRCWMQHTRHPTSSVTPQRKQSADAGVAAVAEGGGVKMWKQGVWTMAALACVAVGVLCKETALIGPALMIAMDVVHMLHLAASPSSASAGTKHRLWHHCCRCGVVAIVWVSAAYVRVYWISNGYSSYTNSTRQLVLLLTPARLHNQLPA